MISFFMIHTLIFLSLLHPTSAELNKNTRSRRLRHHALSSGSTQLHSRSNVPAGWAIYVAPGNDGGGCYVDGNTRLLSTNILTTSGLSTQSCLSACGNAGYTYAGLEYGQECWCSKTISSSPPNAPSSDCSFRCSGDTCGAGYRLNLYKYTAPNPPAVSTTTSWAYSGCVQDGNARALTGYSYTDGGLTVAKCQAACASKGFVYAGVEIGNECYCGNSLVNGLGKTLSDNQCTSTCSDGGSKCGGSWTMSLYKSTTTSSSPSTAASWVYQGCKRDADNRVLQAVEIDIPTATISSCLSTCLSKGYTYGGIEFGYQCFCSNAVNGGAGIDEGNCGMACPGGGTGCGGSWAIALYKYTTSPGAALTPITTTSPTSISTTATSPATIPTSSSWTYLYCAVDGSARALTGANYVDVSGMTVSKCLAYCSSKGFSLGGVQTGTECWCGNTLSNSLGNKGAESDCSSPCPGDSSTGKCGGSWRISLWSTLSGSALSSALGQNATTTKTTTTAASTTTTKVLAITTPAAIIVPTVVAPASYRPTNPVPADGDTKYVWAHHIVGNTYPYTQDTWMADIRLASANGIDGFMLNVGTDPWQPGKVADAYAAAANSGTGFKMMLSFDMTVFSCNTWSSVSTLQSYLQYLTHPSAAKYKSKPLLTTFSGESCTFGQGSTNSGWAALLGSWTNQIYFMPAYNAAPTSLGGYDIQGMVNWGSAWPSGGQDIEMSRDQWFMQQLNPSGKGYTGTVSPLFYSHMSYKNYLWRGDDWLYAMRWEQLISMRTQIDQIEVVSWNDYGESTYIGPIEGDMPDDAKLYANPSFPHTDILSLNAFYASVWKNGQYPLITSDKVWIMARPHPAMSGVAIPTYGPPDHRDYTQDNFYAQVHLVAPASVILCAGSSCSTKQGNAGINRFSQPLITGQGLSVRVVRDGQTTVNLQPSFTFDGNPQRYNFNYLIKSS